MRGKEDFDPEDIDEDGITPAYAGKSYGYYTIEVTSLGSPPPMRGKD